MPTDRKERLETSIEALKSELGTLIARESEVVAQLHDKEYKRTAERYITLLHEYNEIRDLAHCTQRQSFATTRGRNDKGERTDTDTHLIVLLGQIALSEQTTQARVMQRFGVSVDD